MTLYQNDLLPYKPYAVDFPYRSIVKRDLVQLRNNPHPMNVKHIKGFLGQPTQMVNTEKDETITQQNTIEGYVKESMKNGKWNFKNDKNKFVKKSKDLDQILSLQYFTGLQNFSFKENYLPYLGYREYFNDWRMQLRNLTENAYQPIMDERKIKNGTSQLMLSHPNEWINGNGEPTRSKSMYSETGRLSTANDLERKMTSRQRIRSQQRISTSLSKNNDQDDSPDFDKLDASIFVLLANFLQTKSAHTVQNWLSQSSERERAIMISMIQTVLSNKNAIQSKCSNGPINVGTQTINEDMIPSTFAEEKNQNIHENNTDDVLRSDILIVEDLKLNNESGETIRPPTSSTFKLTKVNRLDTGKRSSNASMWIQKESTNVLY